MSASETVRDQATTSATILAALFFKHVKEAPGAEERLEILVAAFRAAYLSGLEIGMRVGVTDIAATRRVLAEIVDDEVDPQEFVDEILASVR